MPYIDKHIRSMVRVNYPDIPGDLNFLITEILDKYLRDTGLNYRNINAAIGVLECAKLELYRRIAAPYEDKKIAENGDVYSEEILS